MPNWCEGTLKVRGKAKDLRKFIVEGLEPVDIMGNNKEPLEFVYGECETPYKCWIRGMHRGFVNDFYVYIDEELSEEELMICLNTKFAWDINAEALRKISSQYQVDMKIYAFERGMEFNRDIEIAKGEIVKNEEIKFSDYEWECICPLMGG